MNLSSDVPELMAKDKTNGYGQSMMEDEVKKVVGRQNVFSRVRDRQCKDSPDVWTSDTIECHHSSPFLQKRQDSYCENTGINTVKRTRQMRVEICL
jgi:hypothetical protein